MVRNAVDFLVGEEAALDPGRGKGSRGQIEHIAPAQQLLAAVPVQNGPGIHIAGRLESDPAGDVRLDQAGNDIHGRALRRDNQMNARRPGQLGQPADVLFHILLANHHQVGQLINDNHNPGHGLLSRPQDIVVSFQVAHAPLGEFVIPLHHLRHSPGQRRGCLVGIVHHRQQQMRNAVIALKLHHLGVHQNHLDLVRTRPEQQAVDNRIDAYGFTGSRGAGNQHMGHLRQVTDNRHAGDILAQRHRQDGFRVLHRRAFQHLPQGHGRALGVGHFHAHQALAGNRRLDADGGGRHAGKDIPLQLSHLAHLCARRQLQLKAGNDRTVGHMHHPGLHLEAGQRRLQLPGPLLILPGCVQDADIRFLQIRDRRSVVGCRLPVFLLLLLLHVHMLQFRLPGRVRDGVMGNGDRDRFRLPRLRLPAFPIRFPRGLLPGIFGFADIRFLRLAPERIPVPGQRFCFLLLSPVFRRPAPPVQVFLDLLLLRADAVRLPDRLRRGFGRLLFRRLRDLPSRFRLLRRSGCRLCFHAAGNRVRHSFLPLLFRRKVAEPVLLVFLFSENPARSRLFLLLRRVKNPAFARILAAGLRAENLAFPARADRGPPVRRLLLPFPDAVRSRRAGSRPGLLLAGLVIRLRPFRHACALRPGLRRRLAPFSRRLPSRGLRLLRGCPGLLLLLQDIGLLLIRHLPLPLLLLLEGNLLLILRRPVLPASSQAQGHLPRRQIPNPGRRQVQRQQHAERRQQECDDRAQDLPHQTPEGKRQNHAQRAAAGFELNALKISAINHAAPASVRGPCQQAQIFLLADPGHQHDERAKRQESQEGKHKRLHRRLPLAGPDHQHPGPDRQRRQNQRQPARQAKADLPQRFKDVSGHPQSRRQEHHDAQGYQHQPSYIPQGQRIRRIYRLLSVVPLRHPSSSISGFPPPILTVRSRCSSGFLPHPRAAAGDGPRIHSNPVHPAPSARLPPSPRQMSGNDPAPPAPESSIPAA